MHPAMTLSKFGSIKAAVHLGDKRLPMTRRRASKARDSGKLRILATSLKLSLRGHIKKLTITNLAYSS